MSERRTCFARLAGKGEMTRRERPLAEIDAVIHYCPSSPSSINANRRIDSLS
jgi:hypothetical protein